MHEKWAYHLEPDRNVKLFQVQVYTLGVWWWDYHPILHFPVYLGSLMVRLSSHPAFCWNVGVKSTGLTISPSPYSSAKWNPVESSVMLQLSPGLHACFLQCGGISFRRRSIWGPAGRNWRNHLISDFVLLHPTKSSSSSVKVKNVIPGILRAIMSSVPTQGQEFVRQSVQEPHSSVRGRKETSTKVSRVIETITGGVVVW